MGDIVERLRDIYSMYYTREERQMIEELRSEAADEIERLRNALEERGLEVYGLRGAIRTYLGHPDGLRDTEACIAALASNSDA